MRFREAQVVEVGRPASGVVHDVVGLTPTRRSVATREHATAVASDERPPLRGRRHSYGVTEVDRHAEAVDDDRRDRSVAGQPLGGRPTEHGASIRSRHKQRRTAQGLAHGGGRIDTGLAGAHNEGDERAGRGRGVGVGDGGSTGEFHQRVGAPL